MISIISAIAKNKVIGNKNGLPWHLPADFKYFKEKTAGKVLIMGLNTFKSIGEKPLPSRKHVILCDKPEYKVPGDNNDCFLASSVDQALEVAKELSVKQASDEIMICGGAFVYKQFLPLADRLYLTYINQDFEGDIYFPEFNLADWKEISRQDFQSDPLDASGQAKNQWSYSFVVLDRI
jgi:dihydrofolate reductase